MCSIIAESRRRLCHLSPVGKHSHPKLWRRTGCSCPPVHSMDPYADHSRAVLGGLAILASERCSAYTQLILISVAYLLYPAMDTSHSRKCAMSATCDDVAASLSGRPAVSRSGDRSSCNGRSGRRVRDRAALLPALNRHWQRPRQLARPPTRRGGRCRCSVRLSAASLARQSLPSAHPGRAVVSLRPRRPLVGRQDGLVGGEP